MFCYGLLYKKFVDSRMEIPKYNIEHHIDIYV